MQMDRRCKKSAKEVNESQGFSSYQIIDTHISSADLCFCACYAYVFYSFLLPLTN